MCEPILAWEPLEGRGGHEAGRALLARLYREAAGTDCPAIALTDRGKPYFDGSPLHFSISHTKAHVFCALWDRPLGIDAEEMDREIRLGLADRILSPGERARFDAAPDKRQALLRLWVLKEAVAKYTGEGLRGFPNQTDFDPNDPRVREIDGCYVAVITE